MSASTATQILAEEAARFMMVEILYDNGCVNRLEPEKKWYPLIKRHLKSMAVIIEEFVAVNIDHLFNDEIWQQIAIGEGSFIERFDEHDALNVALENFFEKL